MAATQRQLERYAGLPAACNAQLPPCRLRELTAPTAAAWRLLGDLHDRHALSARGHAKVLRVARTLADLADSAKVTPDHVLAAAALRMDAGAVDLAA